MVVPFGILPLIMNPNLPSQGYHHFPYETNHPSSKAKDLLGFQGSTRLRQGKAFFCGGPEPRKTSPDFVGNYKKYLVPEFWAINY